MKFEKPRLIPNGSLRRVTATASGTISDQRVKRDVEEYEDVLPRIAKLTSSRSRGGAARGRFVTPEVRHGGSLRDVTAITSGDVISDARHKEDVREYDAVLPRIAQMSGHGSNSKTHREEFVEPAVRRKGSLEKVTSAASDIRPT